MTEPPALTATELREYLYGLGSMLAVLADQPGIPSMPLPEREASPAATRTAVDAAVADTAAALDAMLSRKRLPPSGLPTATRGRRLVSRDEKFDADGSYAPGPGLEALINVLRAGAATTKGQ